MRGHRRIDPYRVPSRRGGESPDRTRLEIEIEGVGRVIRLPVDLHAEIVEPRGAGAWHQHPEVDVDGLGRNVERDLVPLPVAGAGWRAGLHVVERQDSPGAVGAPPQARKAVDVLRLD